MTSTVYSLHSTKAAVHYIAAGCYSCCVLAGRRTRAVIRRFQTRSSRRAEAGLY